MSWLIQSWICSEGNSGSVKAIVCYWNDVSNQINRGIASICFALRGSGLSESTLLNASAIELSFP